MRKLVLFVALLGLALLTTACQGGMLEPTATAIPLAATATPSPRPTRPPATSTATPMVIEPTPVPPPATGTPLPIATSGLTGLDDRLAEGTARGFLDRLAAGNAEGAFALFLTDEAREADAGHLLPLFTADGPRVAEAVLLELRRATASSYEGRALLRWTGGQDGNPATQTMTLKLVYRGGLWLIDAISLGDLQAVAPTSTRRPSTGRPAPRLDGRLVFQTSSGGDIYLVNADGTGLRRLTDGLDPAWSPDSDRIALTRWRTPWGVYLIDPASPDPPASEERVVDATKLKEVAWSPDGTKIAFTVNFGSSEPMKICFFGFCFTIPPFSFGQIWTADLESGELLSLPLDDRAVHAPTWSPSGERIVYAGDRGLAWIDLADMDKAVFAGGSAWDTSPAYAPAGAQGGAQLAFMGRVHDHWEIFIMAADGSGRRQLTHSDPRQENPPSNVAPAWSPDGKHIAFLSNRDGPWRIYVMAADGSDQRPMFGAKLDGLGLRYEWATERVVSWGR